MGFGLGFQLSPGGGSRPRFRVDFRNLTPGAIATVNLAALFPALDLQFSRASDAGGVRTGSSSISISSMGVDVPTIGRVGAISTTGLVIQEPATNLVKDNRTFDEATWSAGTGRNITTEAAELRPDGSLGAIRAQNTSGTYGPLFVGPALGAPSRGAMQWWVRASPGATVPLTSHVSGNWKATGELQYVHGYIISLTEEWQCVSATEYGGSVSAVPVAQNGSDYSTFGGLAAEARDHLIDFMGLWAKGMPMQPQVQGAVLTERSPDDLSFDLDTMLSNTGRLKLLLRIRPYGASWDYLSDGTVSVKALPVVTVDVNNRVYIDTDRRIRVVISGVEKTLPTIFNWGDDKVIDLYMEVGAGPANVYARVDDEVWFVLGKTESSHAAWPSSQRLHILSSASVTDCFSSYLQKVEVW